MSTRTRPTNGYVFDTADPTERERLSALADLCDPFTFRRLAQTGVGPGWRCLEVGAGTGSVAAWLLEQVGPTGSVVATDIETRWLEPMAAGNLEVRHHNVVTDPLDQGYDLIHARLVLEHLPQRRTVAAKLAQALRPGGWLVVEDFDLRTMAITDPPLPHWAAVHQAVVDTLGEVGVDLRTGSHLPGLLRLIRLREISAEGSVQAMPIPELGPAFRPALERLRPLLLAAGHVSAEEIDRTLDEFTRTSDVPSTSYTPMLVSAAGRR